MKTEKNPAEEKAAKQAKKKKMIIGIAVVALLGGVSWVLLENPQIFEPKNENKVTSMYSDELKSYIFYPTDYNLDVTADETYMGLDRYVYYKNGGETFAVTDGNYAQYGKAVAFFGDYFETVIAGDTETYNTYFTDHYYESNEPYIQFAPQMLYDILIEQLSETQNQDGTVIYTFNVSYKIHRNDGTFRNDIDSNASKTLYYELIEDATGTVKIDRITYYR